MNVSRSFRSAPAQKASSLSLVNTSARIPLCSPVACSLSTISLSSLSSWREMALRARGRFSETTVISPVCGAGMLLMRIEDDSEVP